MQYWAYNMRQKNGADYKKAVIKRLWNARAQLLQEKYFKQFNRKFNLFSDLVFKKQDHRDTTRKLLQKLPEKRKLSAEPLSVNKIEATAISILQKNCKKNFTNCCKLQLS